MSETSYVKPLIEALEARGLGLYWRRNVGGRGRLRFGKKGQSDIWGIASDGTHVELELKADGGEVSSEQAAWIETVRRQGGVALVLTVGKGEAEGEVITRWMLGVERAILSRSIQRLRSAR